MSDNKLLKIDGDKIVEKIGRIICYASRLAPARSWHCENHLGINRLYYIHSGSGGYTHNGKEYRFSKNTLYYIPYTASFMPFCDADDPIMHTYIDFELIPPIITNEVLFLNIENDERLKAAVSLFVQGGEMIGADHCDLASLHADVAFWELCKSSIVYLANQIASRNGIEKITDSVVIKALEIMHTRMNEKLSVNDLAMECYMNPDSFIRRFCRVVGVTPHAYLKTLRLRTARYLKEAGMNLSQIASETGYADASSLSHALKGIKYKE